MKLLSRFQFEDVQGYKLGSSYFGKPKMLVHSFFVDGLLIDTGHSNMRKEFMKAISEFAIEQVFITHHHEDHSGNIDPIQAKFKVPIYAHPLCVKTMKNPPSISPAQWLSWGPRKANSKLLSKEEKIETEKFRFDIIPIPGHAHDMVGLYEKNQGWFFSADLFVNTYIRFFMRAESMKEQIKSIKKVLKLDFDQLFCCHNPQKEGGKEKLARKLTFFEDFYGQVKNLYQKGYSVRAIQKQMQVKPMHMVAILSLGELSAKNMIRSVIRDEISASS
ncbi:MAG: MBL fold metallo-hydrolase [Bacteroidota bacterium]